MVMLFPGFEISLAGFVLLLALVAWDAVWKIIGLWKSARNNQIVWFIFIAILNTAGILPIIYIAFFQKKKVGRIARVSRRRKRR